MRTIATLLIFAFTFVLSNTARAENSGPTVSDIQLDVIGNQLLLLLVLAILLEQALTVLFNWRYFQRKFEGRGVKTPIAFAVSCGFVFLFDINAVNEILFAFGAERTEGQKEWPGQLIAALIVAGGSGTVFRLFENFGLRAPFPRQQEILEERKQAHVKIDLKREKSQNKQVLVHIDDSIVGSIPPDKNSSHGNPMARGYSVDPGKHVIKVTAFHEEVTTDGLVESSVSITLAEGASLPLILSL